MSNMKDFEVSLSVGVLCLFASILQLKDKDFGIFTLNIVAALLNLFFWREERRKFLSEHLNK